MRVQRRGGFIQLPGSFAIGSGLTGIGGDGTTSGFTVTLELGNLATTASVFNAAGDNITYTSAPTTGSSTLV